MNLLFILPKAKRISSYEKNYPKTDDRIFNLEFLFNAGLISFGAVVVLGLGTARYEEFIEENSTLNYVLIFIFSLLLGTCLIFIFISSIRVVVSNGEIVEIASQNGGKVQDAPLLVGAGIIFLFYAVIEGDKGNQKGAYPLAALFGFIILRALFRITLKPLTKGISIMIRQKKCTVPVRAELFRKIETRKELIEETEKLYAEQHRERTRYFDSILIYEYCYEDQYYRIAMNELYFIKFKNYEHCDIYIDPDAPEKFMIRGHYYFKVDMAEIEKSTNCCSSFYCSHPLYGSISLQIIYKHI